jgi:hypothetical protein
LSIIGTPDAKVIERLKDCNINWITKGGTNAPEVTLNFSNNGKKKSVTYYVMGNGGRELVKRNTYTYTDPDEAGLTLAYKLFKINKDPKI